MKKGRQSFIMRKEERSRGGQFRDVSDSLNKKFGDGGEMQLRKRGNMSTMWGGGTVLVTVFLGELHLH